MADTTQDKPETIRVKIVYDGQGPSYNVRVEDAYTGKLIEGVLGVSFDWRARIDPPVAHITILCPVVEATLDGEIKREFTIVQPGEEAG